MHDRCLPGAGVGVNGVGRIFKARLAAGAKGPRGRHLTYERLVETFTWPRS